MTDQEFLEQINNSKPVIHKACTVYCYEHSRDDLVQEIILEIYRSLNNFKKNCSFSTWAYTIARNKCISLLRKQKNDPKIVGLEEYSNTLADVSNAPEMVKQLREAIKYDTVMDSIDEAWRTVFEMYVQGISFKEMEEQTGIAEATLRVNTFRIKKRLYLRYGKSEDIK